MRGNNDMTRTYPSMLYSCYCNLIFCGLALVRLGICPLQDDPSLNWFLSGS